MLAHISGEVGTSCTVLLSIYSGTCLPVFIEICSYLTDIEQKIIWHIFFEIQGRLDYANAGLSGTTSGNLVRLQVAQNSLARVVCQASHSTSATELRLQLRWLPIRQLAVITYRTRSTAHEST